MRRWLPTRELVAVCDNTSSTLDWLDAVRHEVWIITRLPLDAVLYQPASAQKPKQNGRPPQQEARLPTLVRAVVDPTIPWKLTTVEQWYRQGKHPVQITSATAVWYHSGLPPVPIRWVLVRDPEGKLAPEALLSTNLALAPLRILTWFVQRWQLLGVARVRGIALTSPVDA